MSAPNQPNDAWQHAGLDDHGRERADEEAEAHRARGAEVVVQQVEEAGPARAHAAGAPTIATVLISTPPALRSAAAMRGAERGADCEPDHAAFGPAEQPPHRAQPAEQHDRPEHAHEPGPAELVVLVDHELRDLAAESSGLGGLPGRKPAISISTTSTMPASASERSDLRSSTSPPLGGAAPGRWCLLPAPFASIVRFAGRAHTSPHDGRISRRRPALRARLRCISYARAVAAGGIIIAVIMLLLLPSR